MSNIISIDKYVMIPVRGIEDLKDLLQSGLQLEKFIQPVVIIYPSRNGKKVELTVSNKIGVC